MLIRGEAPVRGRGRCRKEKGGDPETAALDRTDLSAGWLLRGPAPRCNAKAEEAEAEQRQGARLRDELGGERFSWPEYDAALGPRVGARDDG